MARRLGPGVPCGPAGPTGPCGPVTPWGPGTPCGPCGPAAPYVTLKFVARQKLPALYWFLTRSKYVPAVTPVGRVATMLTLLKETTGSNELLKETCGTNPNVLKFPPAIEIWFGELA